MKKTLIFFFLALFLFNLFGFYLVFDYCEHENRKDIQRSLCSIPAHALIELKIPASLTEQENTEFSQTEEDEISYQGKMYDVVSTVRKNDGFVYYSCLNDEHEDELRTTFNEQQKDITDETVSVPAKKNTHRISLNDLIKDYIPGAEILTYCHPHPSAAFLFPALDFRCKAPYAEIISPPPQRS